MSMAKKEMQQQKSLEFDGEGKITVRNKKKLYINKDKIN